MPAIVSVGLLALRLVLGLSMAAHGIEMPLLYTAGAFALALTGPGRFSLDALRRPLPPSVGGRLLPARP